MFVFASAVTKPPVYARCAAPGIALAREADSVVIEHPSAGTLFAAYNAILDQVAAMDGVEALVLLHQDSEIVGEDFCARAREALAHPGVGLAGCAGAIGVRSIAWWEGSVTCASFVHRYDELGGGDMPAFSWTWGDAPPYARLGEVETLDGFLLVLSPWSVANVRFDENLGSSLHGYDLDFCLQVRAGGRKVVTGDFRAIHHHGLHAFSDPQEWIAAHVRIAEKWEGQDPGLPGFPGAWRDRALRAEAEAASARGDGQAKKLKLEARTRELEHALEETRTSVSWRVAAPLRRMART